MQIQLIGIFLCFVFSFQFFVYNLQFRYRDTSVGFDFVRGSVFKVFRLTNRFIFRNRICYAVSVTFLILSFIILSDLKL